MTQIARERGPRRPGGRGAFYGWWMVGLSALVLAVVIGPIVQGLGTFFVALEREFGWSRAALAGAFSMARAEDSLIGPAVGYLTDRLGTRRLVLGGFLVLGAGFVMLGLVQSIVGFYGAFFVITVGAGFAGFLPMMGALNHWFLRYRATAMGMAQAGVSVGGLLVPALAWGITFAGWRTTATGIGVVMWLLALPVAAAIRNRPEQYGQHPDGRPPVDAGGQAAPPAVEGDVEDYTLGQALRARAFWLIALAHAFAAVVFMTMGVHAVPMITDKGYSLEMAALVVAVYTLVTGVLQVLGGLVGDRVPKRPAIAVFMGIQGVAALVAAPAAAGLPTLFLFAVLLGIGAGGRTPLLIAIRGDYFGRRAFATIFGFSTLPMSLVLVAGPVLVGYLVDLQGSYTVSMIGLGAASFLGAGLILAVPPRGRARPRPRGPLPATSP